MSLAQVLAAARSAHNLILVGDPQQLEQPQKGAHPEGTDVDALTHILAGDDTIACDGAQYHSSEEAYMYDMYRQKQIEEGSNLKFYRIWSTNWWVDPIKETQNLVKFINSLEESKNQTDKSVKPSFISDEPIIIEPIDIISKQTQEPITVVDDNKVNLDSTVIIKDINNGEIIEVKFTRDESKVNLETDEKIIISYSAPLADSLMNKIKGEKVKVEGIEAYYQIVKIDSEKNN